MATHTTKSRISDPVKMWEELSGSINQIVSFIATGRFKQSCPTSDPEVLDQIEAEFVRQLALRFGQEQARRLADRYKRGALDHDTREVAILARRRAKFLVAQETKLQQKAFSDSLSTALRTAYNHGGLDSVDWLIDVLNAKLKGSGSPVGLGEGAALSHAPDGAPQALMVTFREHGGRDHFGCKWIALNEK